MLVHVEGYGVIRARRGDNLGRLLAANGLIPLPCGGRGLCGQCLVYVEGDVSEVTGNEIARGLSGNRRLACQVTILGNVKVNVLRKSLKRIKCTSTLSYNVELKFLTPIFRILKVEEVSSELKKYIPISKPEGSGYVVIIDELFASYASESRSNALLIDLGTSKIAYCTVDEKGNFLKEAITVNPLVSYGADIMTRVTKALDDPRTYSEMQSKLHNFIYDLIELENPAVIAVAGNSVMEYTLMGLPLKCFAEYPFQPFIRGPFLYVLPKKKYPVVMLPLLAGFVGGDAFASLLAAEYMGLSKPYLIVDLGTNTEILLATESGYYVTSAPAGPAFEGHISCGSTVALGGIEEVRIINFKEDGSPVFTIKGEPIGLLGSGVISLVAELLRNKLINKRGRITRGYEIINGMKGFKIAKAPSGEDVIFTYHDLREFQKAMAAVKAGWRVLLEKAGVDSSKLKHVILSGLFGSKVNSDDVRLLRLIPPVDKSKVLIAGDLVLAGLRIYVFDSEAARALANKIRGRNIFDFYLFQFPTDKERSDLHHPKFRRHVARAG